MFHEETYKITYDLNEIKHASNTLINKYASNTL